MFPAADNGIVETRTPHTAPCLNKHTKSLGAQVDVLITVSGFAMMPSQSAAVAARFGMRDDLDAYHLAGHGCAGSTLSMCLARQLLLAVRPPIE